MTEIYRTLEEVPDEVKAARPRYFRSVGKAADSVLAEATREKSASPLHLRTLASVLYGVRLWVPKRRK